nr:MAG TPA: hypothetical protein [Caudoviricetes sp.]
MITQSLRLLTISNYITIRHMVVTFHAWYLRALRDFPQFNKFNVGYIGFILTHKYV